MFSFKKISLFVCLLAISFTFAQYGQGQFQTRSLLEKKIFYIYNGKIESSKYWSIPLGTFELTLSQKFPGEGVVDFGANINFALLSSGYIEGTGYGERGKATATANYAVEDGDSLRTLEFSDIEYVYLNGSKVKLKDKKETQELYIKCGKNKVQSKKISIMKWRFDNTFKELKHDKDIDRIIGFAFTKENALKALQTQKRETAN